MGGINMKRPTATKGTMNHPNTSISTEIFAGAILNINLFDSEGIKSN
jgi:hypothetical protein